MARCIETFALVFFFYAQPDRQIDQLEEDEADRAGPADGHENTERLSRNLATHVVAVDTDAAQSGRDEDTGADSADDAANTMNAEHVE